MSDTGVTVVVTIAAGLVPLLFVGFGSTVGEMPKTVLVNGPLAGAKLTFTASASGTATTLTATFMARWSDLVPIHVPCNGIASRGSRATATRTRSWFPTMPPDGSKSIQPGPGT